MKYAGIIKNDFAAAPGTCVTFFTQGCPYHCDGCQNPEAWDFLGGKEFTPDTLKTLISALTANNIHRDLCIMGGEPLCKENAFLTYLVIDEIKKVLPNTKIYVWTGGLYEDLIKSETPKIKEILNRIDCLIDGPFIKEKRDISLFMRGSSNQRIIYLTNKEIN